MATKKNDDSVEFTHVNGAKVTVAADKAERLDTTALFTRAGGRTAKPSS